MAMLWSQKTRSRAAAVALALLVAGCSSGTSSDDVPAASPSATTDGSTDESVDTGERATADLTTSHDDALAALAAALPIETRSVTVVDLASVSEQAPTWIDGGAVDPAIKEIFSSIDLLTGTAELRGELSTVLVGHLDDPAEGPFLLAAMTPEGEALAASGIEGAAEASAILPGPILVVGSQSSVSQMQSGDTANGLLTPFIDALPSDADVGYAHAMPALYGDEAGSGSPLHSAAAMTGFIALDDGMVEHTATFHMRNGEDFASTFDGLNAAALAGDRPLEQPLVVAAPLVDDFDQVSVRVPTIAVDASFEETRNARNVFKKLFAGMDAYAYAEGVGDGGNAPWLDFVVKSEADAAPSPGSVYIRWEFVDQAAVEAFEANELPEGFRLAKTSFLETDDPDGEYFFALNLYNAAGGSIVTGARAEWDVFVHGPEGADPNAGERPRFGVVEVLAEEVSADSRDLLTPAQPMSHVISGGNVVSTVQRNDANGQPIDAFSSSFPVPDPATAPVARFTREMAIGNDYIYWAHGVSDRVLYNATTFNHDAYFVDISQLDYIDNTRWAQYLRPEAKDAVYYVNSLEYVASPMSNLRSEFLDITPEWNEALLQFRNNGHQRGLMRGSVELLFRGAVDPFVGVTLTNDAPATFFNFAITDPAGLETALALPPGHSLAPISLFEDGEAQHTLTLAVYEIDGSSEGTRAEWIVYTDDGDGRPPGMVVVDLLTQRVGFDPASILNVPSLVVHSVDGGTVSTTLGSLDTAFAASFEFEPGTDESALSLDWIEAGDIVCSINLICNKHYYDAETLDVPVEVAVNVAVTELRTPWDAFIDQTPVNAFVRDNFQELAVKPWFNLDIVTDDVPFSGLADPTHSIGGAGSLAGRDTDIVNSDYVYTGDAILDGNELTFAIDQEITNAIGVAHIVTTGVFDLTTGTGSQTVIGCTGAALLCSDVESGSTGIYTAEALNASDSTAVTWEVNAAVVLGSEFGTADSASTFTAVPVN